MITSYSFPWKESNVEISIFLKLQDELASTENQILTARTRFNESVQAYNGYVLAMPQSMFLGSYPEKPYFKSAEGADKPVEVKF